MTLQQIYRLWCDTPGCDRHTVVDDISYRPDGWTRIRSTAHLAAWAPGQQLTSASGRRYRDQRSHTDIHAGSFMLHLCPQHPDTFDGHRPETEGTTGRRGRYSTTVRCECGWSTWGVPQERVVGRRPAHASEWEWWRHLPAELQQYATRSRDTA